MGAVVSLTDRRLAGDLQLAAPFLAQLTNEGLGWSVDHSPTLGWTVYVTVPGVSPDVCAEHPCLALAAEQAVKLAAHRNLERQLAGSVINGAA